MKVINLKTGVTVLEEAEPVLFDKERVILKLKENLQEYFYGGGVQTAVSHTKARPSLLKTKIAGQMEE